MEDTREKFAGKELEDLKWESRDDAREREIDRSEPEDDRSSMEEKSIREENTEEERVNAEIGMEEAKIEAERPWRTEEAGREETGREETERWTGSPFGSIPPVYLEKPIPVSSAVPSSGGSMGETFEKQIQKQENIYSKGNVLIVGKRIPKNKGAYETNGVILYHAYCLGTHPYLIQDDDVSLTEGNLYICGDSDRKAQTISGYTMLEIAGMLYYKCKYRGEQKIIIMTSYGKRKNDIKEDMADMLRDGLESFHIKAEVEVFAANTAVLVDYFGNAYASDISYAPYIFAKVQDRMLRKIGTHPLILEMESYQKEIMEYILNSGIEVARFNHSVIKKSRNKVTWFMMLLKGLALAAVVVGLAVLLAVFVF